MLIKTIFSGFGGQGVLSLGQTLARAAMLEDKYVTYLPSYGAEVRGGTANCTVTISDEEIASPIASEPEFVVALNQPSFFRFQNLLPSGGLMLYNASLGEPSTSRGDIEIQGIPITELATNLGNVKVANMIMLGAFIRVSNLISFERILKNLPEILGAGKSRLLKTNQEALQIGFTYVKEQKKCL
jgi:2-oxoglutarate ferredoxin oxidoreductase subunit gamma